MNAESFKVRLRKTEIYEGKRKTTHYVRWTVAGVAFKEPFDFADGAESYLAKLRTAANDGLPFSTTTGEPVAWAREAAIDEPEPAPVLGVLDHFRDYINTRWRKWSAHHRENVAEALMNAGVALLPQSGRPAEAALRKALRRHAFNCMAAEATGNVAAALTWPNGTSRP